MAKKYLFTFQYVSIKTLHFRDVRTPQRSHLHSNMFLLRRRDGKKFRRHPLNLHSNMFLLRLTIL